MSDPDPDTDIDESTVGETPLVELDLGVAPTVYAKVEWFNLYTLPYAGSVKTRIAKAMLDAAEESGDLPGRTILEPSSGNTGRALARIGAARGYDVEIIAPDDAARGKVESIREAGGEIRFTPAEEGYDAILARRDELVAEFPDRYFCPDQYENPANPRAHREGTGAELWRQTDGRVTAFVAGAGTGGTVTGVAAALGDRAESLGHPRPRAIAYEPAGAPHTIHGLKYLREGGYRPDTYGEADLDGKLFVSTAEAYREARDLRERYADGPPTVHDPGQHDPDTVREHLTVDGDFLVGPSAGGAVAAVRALDRSGAFSSDDVVAIPLPDRGDVYAESALWETETATETEP